MRPLQGIRVVEAAPDLAASMCGKLLADAGASVQRVVMPGWAGSATEIEPTVAWSRYLNVDKQLVEIGGASADRPAELQSLLRDAHVYLTSSRHDDAREWGGDCRSLLASHPHLVCACVTPFGQEGPYASFRGDDAVLCALAGLADATPGFPDRREREDQPPVQSRAPLAEMAGAFTAGVALFGALFSELSGNGGPRHIEVSALEAAIAAMPWEWGTTSYGGEVRGRRPGHSDLEPNCYLRCKDGNVIIVAFHERHWEALVDMMGRPAWAAAPEFRDAATRARNWQALHGHLRAWLAEQRALDVLVEAQSRGLPCAPAFELRDTLATPHVREGRFLRGDGERGMIPADPVRLDGHRRPPTPGGDAVRPLFAPSADAPARQHRPLEGVRVLDLGQFAAGPYTGQLLASLGAEVILVESRAHLISRDFGPFAGAPGPNSSMMFNHVSRGKASVELDLTTAEGAEILADLAGSCDVVLENFSRRAAQKLGLTYDRLAQRREDIILASISGFGRQGPWGDYVALHSGVILLSGLASVTRDEDARPRLVGSIYPDLLTGAYMASAIVQALMLRRQSGRGCHLEVSMLDVLFACMGGLIPAECDGDANTPAGSKVRFLETADQHGFLAVSQPPGGLDEREIGRRSGRDSMTRLQGEGVKAAAVLDMQAVMADPHLHATGFVVTDDHPLSHSPVPAVPWRYDGRRPALSHAPLLGDRTEDVLVQRAGVQPSELEPLRERRVVW